MQALGKVNIKSMQTQDNFATNGLEKQFSNLNKQQANVNKYILYLDLFDSIRSRLD